MNTSLSCAAVATLTVFAVSCGFHPFETEIEVTVPSVPRELPASVDTAVLLKVDCEEAGGIELPVSAGEVRKLKVPKARVLVLTAYYKGGIPPAGAVLPYDSGDSSQVKLTFAQGFCSGILTRLAQESFPLSVLNYRRLIGECREKSGGNPFVLDSGRIYRALKAGNFSLRDIVKLTEYELPGDALPEGCWSPANPLGEVLHAGTPVLVAEGRWNYYSNGTQAVLWCDKQGWHFYALDGAFSRSGAW
ncbi:hypothetical protein [Marispirochaeta sp.]|uniref:hypothetical protein n=1 Tax=Marispirochaeta sp. TaxID=2038653 RepID=UPI0029C94ECE|nr:hypothetical protein [Marispirochaeta sp.]